MSEWSSPFPDGVAFVAVDPEVLSHDAAHPDELAQLRPRVVDRRRREFVLGRIAARRAIEALGHAPRPVLVGPQREPQWPPGLRGSITHCGDMAAAAVAEASITEGLGLDVEDSRRITSDVEAMVTDAIERRWSAGDPLRVAMLFSAKESIFKAFYRLRGELFGFEAVRLRATPEGLRATLRERLGPDHPAGAVVEVGCVRRGPLVMTSVLLPGRAQPSG